MANKYLLDNEIATYCEFFSDVTPEIVAKAEMLIDSFCGGSLTSTSATELVKINRKNLGHLNNNMVTSITSVYAKYITPTGITSTELDKSNVVFDEEGNIEYLNFASPLSINAYLGYQLYGLEITYVHGLITVPTDLKRITAMIAQNILQNGDYSGAKTKSGLDFNVMMFDDSVLPSDIRMALQKYRRG